MLVKECGGAPEKANIGGARVAPPPRPACREAAAHPPPSAAAAWAPTASCPRPSPPHPLPHRCRRLQRREGGAAPRLQPPGAGAGRLPGLCGARHLGRAGALPLQPPAGCAWHGGGTAGRALSGGVEEEGRGGGQEGLRRCSALGPPCMPPILASTLLHLPLARPPCLCSRPQGRAPADHALVSGPARRDAPAAAAAPSRRACRL